VLPANLPEVMVDADRVRTVILNLVHNAIKFTPPEGQSHGERARRVPTP
jgi:two-component system phosphate regulon sensor histidine kinase PhoR